MSEPFKIRVGSKSNKGTLKSENDDRILIGMDPAANDWLFSPDPVQVGEFGTVLLLADGLGDNQNGGFAANAICKTIKKLFDETLELPPQDDEKLRLLTKFFQIAQKQLHTLGQEQSVYKNIGASATLVLLLDNKAYIVWLGNCRVYRYNSKGVNKSFFTDLPQLELLSVDHTFETEKALFNEYRELKYYYPPGISKYITDEPISNDISSTVISLKKLDRILICSEGLFSALNDETIQDVMTSFDDPGITADELISRAFNSGSEKNISAVIADILEVEPTIPIIQNSDLELIEKARLLYGVPMANVVLPPAPKEKPSISYKKDKTIPATEDLLPVKLRTVMPEPDLNADSEKETPVVIENTEPNAENLGQMKLEWPAESPAETIETFENEEAQMDSEIALEEENDVPDPVNDDTDAGVAAPLSPEAPPSQIQGEMAERLARLKIKMTVYPDPEDKDTDKKENPNSKIGSLFITNEADTNPKAISIDLYDEDKENEDLDDANTVIEPNEESIPENVFEAEYQEKAEQTTESEAELDQEVEVKIADPFESADIPVSENFFTDVEEEISSNSEAANELSDEEDIEEEETMEALTIEQEPVILIPDATVNQMIDDSTTEEPAQKNATVQKPIAHLIHSDSDETNTATAEKKPKLWPYFAVLGLLILIPIWICKDNSDLNSDSNMDGASTAISIEDEKPRDQQAVIIPAETEPVNEPEPENDDETEIINPPSRVVPDPETASPKEKKKEVAPPKSDSKEPKYDPEIEKNKHQLLGEVQALMQRKNQLCKQISTYGKNAPESKSEAIKQIQGKCDQLGQKFSSIYDQKSGFFKTVRYDFMSGTIKSIRVSMDQIDQQFETIRGE